MRGPKRVWPIFRCGTRAARALHGGCTQTGVAVPAAMITEANRIEFEQRGPDGVRRQIEHALYDAEKQKQAYEWLDETERGHDRALMRMQIAIASSAKDAAWASAGAAKAANRRSTIALVISVVSALASVVGLFLIKVDAKALWEKMIAVVAPFWH